METGYAKEATIIQDANGRDKNDERKAMRQYYVRWVVLLLRW
jgi:hypothetical protein